MTTHAYAPTARCVHCSWTADTPRGSDLQEVRDIHELIHPGGTVLVGSEVDEIMADVEEVLAQPSTNGGSGGLTRWSREKAIEAVKAFHERHGRIPTQHEFRKANALPSSAYVQREFGGLAKLMEVCGFEPNRKGGRPAGSGSSPSDEAPKREAVPPPAPEPEPAPKRTEAVTNRTDSETSGNDPEPPGSLVDLAQRVTDLTERCDALREQIAVLEREHAEAVAALSVAVDGLPRSDARARSDAVRLTFTSKWGPLRYETAEFTGRWGEAGWQQNLRAIALAMEALRKVDRYGVSKRGEQYRGWRQLMQGTDPADSIATPEIARAFLGKWDGDWKAAAKATHPDLGGDASEYRKVMRAKELVGG